MRNLIKFDKIEWFKVKFNKIKYYINKYIEYNVCKKNSIYIIHYQKNIYVVYVKYLLQFNRDQWMIKVIDIIILDFKKM